MWRLNKNDTVSGMKMATRKMLWEIGLGSGRVGRAGGTALSRVPPPARPWGPHIPLAASPECDSNSGGREISERCWSWATGRV